MKYEVWQGNSRGGWMLNRTFRRRWQARLWALLIRLGYPRDSPFGLTKLRSIR